MSERASEPDGTRSPAAFERLLSPGRLGSLELRNRIALCPMGTNLAEADGSVGDDQAAWLEARARGGAGLILVGSASVAYPAGSYGARQVAISDDRFVPGLRRMVGDVHRHGAAIAAQLVHDGSQSMLDIAEGRPLLVPSKRRPPDPDELSTMLTPAELAAATAPFVAPGARLSYQVATDEDLAWVIDRFAEAARRSVATGFDGIELHAGHGYLLDAFLSPATNRRDDRWGGDAAGRATLLVEVVAAVRAAVGPDFPVWARINAFERHRDPGQGIDDALVAMRLAVDAGLDAVHVTAYAEPMVATGITDGHTTHAPGALLPVAARVRAELGVPVIAMGRLTPEAAEAALADGAADVVAMGRPLIADPDLPAKLAAGRRDAVRPCAYQYRCIGSIFLGDPVRCTVNPDAGREAQVQPTPAGEGRRVVVVGAGPAGLECARRLAARGFGVEVWEAATVAGGVLRIAETIDADLLGLADWLVGAAVDAGVEVRLGVRADTASLAASRADAVVWAAGATWPGVAEAAAWVRADRAGEHVVVRGRGKAAVSTALAAAQSGAVTTLDPLGEAVLAPELGLPGRFRLVAAARDAGVVVEPATHGATATTLDLRPGEPRPAPTLDDHDIDVHVLGDASGTVGLADALRAAADLAERLGPA